MIKCTILGCGSADGSPRIGCNCDVCSSSSRYNKRSRCSALLELDGRYLLIDTSPDFRQQAIQNRIHKVDGIFYTHVHFDHVAGINDVAPLRFSHHEYGIPVFMPEDVAEEMLKQFGHVFRDDKRRVEQPQEYRAFLDAVVIEDSLQFYGHRIQIFKHRHGAIFSYGMRVGNFAYITDVEQLDLNLYQDLQNLQVLIIGCYGKTASQTHMNLPKILKSVQILQPRLTILTHMSHELEYEEMTTILPDGVIPGYDGAIVYINDREVGMI